jgi:L-asparaginase
MKDFKCWGAGKPALHGVFMRMEKIHFVLTGGTIDSYYDSRSDTVVPHKKSVIPEYIASLNLYNNSKFTQVCMKDSRQLTWKDRENILKTIEKSPCSKIIVAHGTYTMPDTARFLKANLKRRDQIIILTGSMIPISGFTFSDAPFNLGYALAQLGTLKPGVYVCMNGRNFIPGEVLKSLYEARFSSIFGEKPDRK